MPLRSISFIIALLLLSACEQQGQPILRGVKIDKAGQTTKKTMPKFKIA